MDSLARESINNWLQRALRKKFFWKESLLALLDVNQEEFARFVHRVMFVLSHSKQLSGVVWPSLSNWDWSGYTPPFLAFFTVGLIEHFLGLRPLCYVIVSNNGHPLSELIGWNQLNLSSTCRAYVHIHSTAFSKSMFYPVRCRQACAN